MKRAYLTESFHGEDNIEAIENLAARGNETLQVRIAGKFAEDRLNRYRASA